jgi:hypothetical protein
MHPFRNHYNLNRFNSILYYIALIYNMMEDNVEKILNYVFINYNFLVSFKTFLI